MSLATLFASVIGRPTRPAPETLEYDALFKGRSGSPAVVADRFLPGLRPVCDDADSYFKDVFAGPLF